jgi:undecaprenyl-diphosphatase
MADASDDPGAFFRGCEKRMVSWGLPEWLRRRLDPDQRYGLRITLFAIATFLVLLPFAFLLSQVTSDGPVTRLDTEIADEIHEEVVESPILEPVSTAISFIGSPPVMYIAAGLAAVYFRRRGSTRIAVFLLTTNLLGGALNTLLKVTVDRPRPDPAEPIGHAMGYSFPSGHTVATTVGFGSLLLAFMPLIAKRWRPPLVVAYFAMVALVAASRMGLVVHYFSDVLAGAIVGFAWLAVSVAAFSIWRSERGRPAVDVGEGVEPETAAETPERR